MDHPQVSGAVPAPVGGKLLVDMSREGGREKRWDDAHNYVRRTVASVTPLKASAMAMVRAALMMMCCWCCH